MERFRAKACPALDAGWVPVRVKKNASKREIGASVPIQSERTKALAALAFRPHGRHQREIEVAGFERIFVFPKRGIVRWRRDGKSGRQA